MPFVVSNCSALQDHVTFEAAIPSRLCKALQEEGEKSLWCVPGDYKWLGNTLCRWNPTLPWLTTLASRPSTALPARPSWVGPGTVKAVRSLCTPAFSLQRGTSFLRAEMLLSFFCFALLCLSQRNPPSSYSINAWWWIRAENFTDQ